MAESLFDLRDFAPPKPAHAEECMYCFEHEDGSWSTLESHERNHLPLMCSVCGRTEPNSLIFDMNHGGPSWIRPVKCTALYLMLNHLTYALRNGLLPMDRDMIPIDLGWRIAPDGTQLPPADWDELHPPMGDYPDQLNARETA